MIAPALALGLAGFVLMMIALAILDRAEVSLVAIVGVIVGVIGAACLVTAAVLPLF